MKAYRVVLFALLLVLGACSQAPTPEANPEEETLTSQGVLAGAAGFVYYVVHNPNAAKPYSVVRYDQATDTKTTIYKGTREIQSVAGTVNGVKVLISMRETADASSDFEIFSVANNDATQLTTNSVDDTNVSATRGAGVPFQTYTAAWETQVVCGILCFKRGIQVRSFEIFGSSNSFVSSGSGDLTQPSISGNGSYIAFIRRAGNMKNVERYNVSTKTSTVIASSSTLGIGYSNPSPSDSGTKVAYHRTIILGGHSIRLYNSGATSTIVSGATFSHPHLTADGNWLTYAQNVNGTYRIKTRSLITNLETDSTAPASPVSHYAPFWQKANP
jgi:WD40-like Beta Propeller Repeat